jgi:hypothetical protein
MAASGPRPGAFLTLSRRAAEFLAQANGPQAAVLEIGGWDTHANQANPNGPSPPACASSTSAWRRCAPASRPTAPGSAPPSIVVSEFGREVAVNGTLGTDHGPAASPSSSAAPSRAAASSPTGRGGEKPALRGPRPAHHDRTCAPSQGCARRSPADRLAQPRRRGLPDSAKVKPLQLLRG